MTGHDERGANAVVQGEKMQGMAKVCLCSETPLSLGQIASRKKIQDPGRRAESIGASCASIA